MHKKTLLIGVKPILDALSNDEPLDKILISNRVSPKLIKEIYVATKSKKVQIQKVPIEKINKISRANHQGIVAFLRVVDYYDLQDLIDQANDRGECALFLILDGITDVRNIGAIIRSAYAYGVNGIIVPEQGVAPLREDAMKTSAGTLKNINICRVKYIAEAINILKLNGIKIFGTDLKANKNITECELNLPSAVIFGSEDEGIKYSVLKNCDDTFKIPMRTHLDSLNVSVAVGICLYSVFLKRM